MLFNAVEPYIRDYGVLAVVIILGLESLGLPLPGETILIFASIMTVRGQVSLQYLILFAWLAAVIGDNFGYLIGHVLGRPLVIKHGAAIGINESRFAAMEKTFERYGALTVAVARFIAGLRQLNGVIAGTLGMHWWKFLFFNALGGAIWVTAWVLGVHFLTKYVEDFWLVAHDLGYAGAGIAVLVLLVGGLYLFRRSENQKSREQQAP
jgi:membrane protein DedA with SNARE-associated domain